MSVERIPLDRFHDTFLTAIELSSVALGGSIVSFSDEFFAEAKHLILVEPAPSLKGQFGPNGALYSGWETRRHNPAYDWCIIKLGAEGSVFGFDVDTTHFNGNEAPQVSVDALYAPGDEPPLSNDPRWREVLPKVNLGPSARHLFKTPRTSRVNYVKLNMYPDGGIARFRVYGLVAPVFPPGESEEFDLASVFSGGRVVATSDQHFGVGANLILPGRGKDMGDGWETKRSREKGHKDWAIIKLGHPGHLSQVDIDTAHFKGNFPESCELHAIHSAQLVPDDVPADHWTPILPRTPLGPHDIFSFALQNTGQPYTHVRVTIYPDGGLKRVRVHGRRAQRPGRVIPAEPLTPEAFAPFGQVVQAYPDSASSGSRSATDSGSTLTSDSTNTTYKQVTAANQGTAVKFHKLALLESSYPSEAGATTGLSVYRCQPIELAPGGRWEVKLLERHPCTNQAFIPMGGGKGDPERAYLVIVALNGKDDRPDLGTMRAFVASAGQGVVYNMNLWHHPMAVIGKAVDFTCVETQIGNGEKLDCEVVTLDGSSGYYAVELPEE